MDYSRPQCRATCPMDAPENGYLTSATKVLLRKPENIDPNPQNPGPKNQTLNPQPQTSPPEP